jgi:predicted butyrate kinase (DUF1464 family)
MKEQTLVEMKNKVDAITRVLQQLIYEQDNLRTLSVGTLEAVKLLPGYDVAIKEMTEKAKAQSVINELQTDEQEEKKLEI